MESPKPEETPEAEPQDTYVNTDPEPVTPSEYEPEQTKEPAINVFNTPIKIILDSEDLKNLPDSLQLPKGYEKLGSLPILSDKPSIEDLKAALQTQKIDCASYLAGYSCGQHDAPAVPSGDIIQVKTGDEIAINSVGFEVVELDGSGNGKGIVKVSMFNNAKFGVEFKGIKVAKGGCVVAGEAILSNVDVALLSEEQRKKLAETYATFTKVLAIADSLAPQIAETYNSIADLLKAVRAKAKIVIDKIAKNEKPSTKELKDLAKLSETAINAKKKELEGLKKQAGADTSKYVASLGTWLVKQDNALACVKTLPSSEPDPKTKKGGPFFDEGSYFGGCDISALTEEEPENNTAFIGVQAIECLTGASLDLAFYYSSIWISMRFDDDIPDDKKPSFGDFEAITHYKDFSWGEAFTSAGISCVGAMLPPFLAPETARKITIGLSVLAGAAEGFATETVKQYEIAEKAIVKQKGKADMMEVVQKIAWKPVIVNAAVGGMITGAVSFLTTSKRFGKLVEVIKKKLKLTDLADTKQGQKIKDYLSGLGQKIPTGRLKSKYGQYLDELGDVLENGLIKGKYSRRVFDASLAGGRILNLSWKGVKFSLKGLNDIKLHLKRFGKSSQNEKAIKRIQDILDGKIEISDYDRIFYTHELQEYSRYKALGIADGINDSKVWDNCHAATLEDFKINEKTTSVYHPDTEPTIEDLLNEN